MCKIFFLSAVIIFMLTAFVDAQKNEKQLESNFRCSADSECTANSICIGNTVVTSGLCTCKKDFIPKKNLTYYECLPELQNFTTDSCKEDIQCQVAFTNYAECKQAKCACKQGSHFYKTRCYETVKLGEICNFQQSCLLKNGNLAGCVDGRCQCGNLQHPVSNAYGESCEDNIRLAQECTNDGQCIVANTRCYGTCRCQPGYTTSIDQTLCLKEAENLFDSCQEDSQCEPISPYAVCDQSYCRCATHFHSYKGTCYRNIKLNGTCNSPEECFLFSELDKYLICKEGICTCKVKFSNDGQKCTNKSTTKQLQNLAFSFAIVFLYFGNRYMNF